jgi:large subunit ribosomal protein L13
MKIVKTYSAKAADVDRQGLLVDASEMTLGRLASAIAMHLMGKNKPSYTPNIDMGDYVVVINADKLKVTGNKRQAKMYRRHSGFPGGLKGVSLGKRLENGDSIGVVADAVRGMLPKNKLESGRLARLKIFAGNEHSHQAQNPQKVEVK